MRHTLLETTIIMWMLMAWFILITVLGIVVVRSSNPKLLLPTGIATLINGILFFLGSLNILWAILMFVAGILMLRDWRRMRKQQSE